MSQSDTPIDSETDAEQRTTTTARDIEAELKQGQTGEFGTPVDAVCTSCKKVRAKRAPVDPDGRSTFKHVCHTCQRSTFWNVVRYLRAEDMEADQ